MSRKKKKELYSFLDFALTLAGAVVFIGVVSALMQLAVYLLGV